MAIKPLRRRFNRWADVWRAEWRADLGQANNRLRAAFDMNVFDHGFIRALNHNLAEVGPGVWRSNQPSPRRLRKLADDGFRTVLNLRGPSEWGSYELEKIACADYGLELIDIRLFSRAPPHKEAIFELAEVFATAERKIILHCKSGADRAGIGAALYVLIGMGGDVEQARRQLAKRFGHFKAAKTGVLDHFLDVYDAFNQAQPTPFLDWVRDHYDRDAVEASFRENRSAGFVVDQILRRE